MGLEPTTFRSEGGRAIHYATRPSGINAKLKGCFKHILKIKHFKPFLIDINKSYKQTLIG